MGEDHKTDHPEIIQMKNSIEKLLSVEHDSKSVGSYQQQYLRQLQVLSQNGLVESIAN